MDKKPKIGQKVYCIYRNAILVEPVFMIGKDSFLLEPYDRNEDSWEWYYEDYGETWFTNLAEAKNKLLNINQEKGIKLKIIKVDNTYYELSD